MPPAHISQKEIAGRLGMHQSTVSYILRGKRLERYSGETRRKVTELARRLNYRPNHSALVLKGQGSRMIGVLEFDIRSSVARRCLEAVCAAIARRGYTPLTLDANWFTLGTDSVCDVLIAQRVEGVVMIGFGDDFAREDLPRLRAAGLPVTVCLGLKVPGLFQIDADRRAAFADLTRRALAAGARNPCFLGRPVSTLRTIHRAPWLEARDGFRKAARAAGIRRPVVEMVQSLPDRPTDFPASGRVGMRALLARRHPPDAVICYNDLMAIGALAECHEQGLRVPGDVAVYGFGNEEISNHLCPALSTMRIREDRLARDVVEQLFARLHARRKNPDRQVLLKSIFEWCPRASTR